MCISYSHEYKDLLIVIIYSYSTISKYIFADSISLNLFC